MNGKHLVVGLSVCILTAGCSCGNTRLMTWDSTGSVFTVSAPISYVFGRPQLPGAPVMIERGPLTGRMLVAELDAVRQLQFETDGGLTDVSSTPAGGTGNAQILGTIGVVP